MPQSKSLLESLLGDTLLCEYIEGAVSSVEAPYSTGMRVVPFTVINQWQHSVRLEILGDPPIDVDGGMGMVVSAGVPHCITVLDASVTQCRWMHLHYTVLGSVDLLSLLPVPRILPCHMGEFLGDQAEKLAALHVSQDRVSWGTIIQRKALGFTVLAQILACAPSEPVVPGTMQHGQRLLPVLRFIQDHLHEDVSRTQLAGLLRLSPTHFHTLFKETLGVAPMDYVKHQRIRRAQRLLVETTLPVSEIAERSGFRDPFHFSRLFKAACHMSPTGYRHAIRNTLLPSSRE